MGVSLWIRHQYSGRSRPMSPAPVRRVPVFFYGLFMDPDLLRTKGVDPVNVQPAHVTGMRLRIGQRAALEESPEDSTYGFLMELTHSELERLYAESSLAVYRPEAVLAELPDGSSMAALSYNLPVAPAPGERNAEYAAKLRALAVRLGLPSHYCASLS
jgi:gamma-glutamyl AIG2-like cyclotransferase